MLYTKLPKKASAIFKYTTDDFGSVQNLCKICAK